MISRPVRAAHHGINSGRGIFSREASVKKPRTRPLSYLQHVCNLASIAHAIHEGDGPSAQELADLVDVDRRTAARYIATLREFGAPLPVDPATRGYRFTRPWSFWRALTTWVEAHQAGV